jgi:putative SOS response-associated peptidase YedK
MCGRYAYKHSWGQIVNLYRLTLPETPPEVLRESYNVAPTHVMPITAAALLLIGAIGRIAYLEWFATSS